MESSSYSNITVTICVPEKKLKKIAITEEIFSEGEETTQIRKTGYYG